jgi:hypothetical protein
MTALDPVALTAELIRRRSVTPADDGALDVVASALAPFSAYDGAHVSATFRCAKPLGPGPLTDVHATFAPKAGAAITGAVDEAKHRIKTGVRQLRQRGAAAAAAGVLGK